MLTKGRERVAFNPHGPLITDNSEALLFAATQGIGIIVSPDWLGGPEVKAGNLVEVLPGWEGSSTGGVYAIMPPGRLVPAKTRIFVDVSGLPEPTRNDRRQPFKGGWTVAIRSLILAFRARLYDDKPRTKIIIHFFQLYHRSRV